MKRGVDVGYSLEKLKKMIPSSDASGWSFGTNSGGLHASCDCGQNSR